VTRAGGRGGRGCADPEHRHSENESNESEARARRATGTSVEAESVSRWVKMMFPRCHKVDVCRTSRWVSSPALLPDEEENEMD
jgi:hypothetical protein